MVTSTNRGNPIEFLKDEWVYSDNKVPLDCEERPCTRCGYMPTKEGYDHCLGRIEGATSACCGHGISEKILILKGDVV